MGKKFGGVKRELTLQTLVRDPITTTSSNRGIGTRGRTKGDLFSISLEEGRSC